MGCQQSKSSVLHARLLYSDNSARTKVMHSKKIYRRSYGEPSLYKPRAEHPLQVKYRADQESANNISKDEGIEHASNSSAREVMEAVETAKSS